MVILWTPLPPRWPRTVVYEWPLSEFMNEQVHNFNDITMSLIFINLIKRRLVKRCLPQRIKFMNLSCTKHYFTRKFIFIVGFKLFQEVKIFLCWLFRYINIGPTQHLHIYIDIPRCCNHNCIYHELSITLFSYVYHYLNFQNLYG